MEEEAKEQKEGGNGKKVSWVTKTGFGKEFSFPSCWFAVKIRNLTV